MTDQAAQTQEQENVQTLSGLTSKKTEAPVFDPNETQEDLEQGQKSRFVNKPVQDLLNDLWGVPVLDAFAAEAIESATKNKRGGIMFTLTNGHEIMWKQGREGEFLGLTNKKNVVDADDAVALVSLAKTKGWESISVHGSTEERDLLWLEAQRQGVHVDNFMPTEDSAVYKMWERLKKFDQENDEGLAKITPAEAEAPKQTAEAKKPAEAEAVAEEKAPEAKAPEAAEEKKPAEPANDETKVPLWAYAPLAVNNGPQCPEAPKEPMTAAEHKQKSKFAPREETQAPAKKPKSDIKQLKAMRNQQIAQKKNGGAKGPAVK